MQVVARCADRGSGNRAGADGEPCGNKQGGSELLHELISISINEDTQRLRIDPAAKATDP
jgi:hypothetical protein